MHVEIEYCHACGYLDRALDLEAALLRGLGHRLEAVTLVVADGGVFRVRAGATTVFDLAEDDFDVDAIVRQVRDHGRTT